MDPLTTTVAGPATPTLALSFSVTWSSPPLLEHCRAVSRETYKCHSTIYFINTVLIQYTGILVYTYIHMYMYIEYITCIYAAALTPPN